MTRHLLVLWGLSVVCILSFKGYIALNRTLEIEDINNINEVSVGFLFLLMALFVCVMAITAIRTGKLNPPNISVKTNKLLFWIIVAQMFSFALGMLILGVAIVFRFV